VAEQLDLAGVDPAHAEQTADRRGLTGAIRADQAHNVAGRQLEAHIAQREPVDHRERHLLLRIPAETAASGRPSG
jgi:hypothetical protein